MFPLRDTFRVTPGTASNERIGAEILCKYWQLSIAFDLIA